MVGSAPSAAPIREIRVFALGVKPEFQHTGVAAGLYRDVWDACRRREITRAETGWILEANEPMKRAMEALAGRIVKRSFTSACSNLTWCPPLPTRLPGRQRLSTAPERVRSPLERSARTINVHVRPPQHERQ